MAINKITTEVQSVTTRCQTKAAEREEQDDIRKVGKAWVTKANEANVECMHLESTTESPTHEAVTHEDPIWQVLADCAITLT